METIIKLNTHELREVLKNGALLALAETVNNLDFSSKKDINEMEPVISAPEIVTSSSVPAEQSQVVPVQQAQGTAPIVAPVEQPTLTAVPVTTQSYTADQLAVAATQISDAGRREELIQLLSSFGVQALTMLPKEQYGTFATKLREMGAKI